MASMAKYGQVWPSMAECGWGRLQRLARAFVWQPIIKLSEFCLVHQNSGTASASETGSVLLSPCSRLLLPFLGPFQQFLPSFFSLAVGWVPKSIPIVKNSQHFAPLSPFFPPIAPAASFLLSRFSNAPAPFCVDFQQSRSFVLLLWMSYNIRYTLHVLFSGIS